ncbi:MAG TPA: DUF4390 domain-containing protein [Burkholderiales bacterium]|jgi:hypothetical protein|nr:DUF4390 domain-containing protein [Burkholderiales bacterium]
MKLLVALLCGAAVALAEPARADEIEVTEAQLASTDEGLALSADFSLELNPRLAEAVANGVSLYFLVEFELTRRRWYWFDEKAAAKRLQIRLSYNALSRHYRLSTGVLQQNYGTLDEALNVLKRVRGWVVLERGAVLADASYDAAVRMRLDVTLLPKPFQLSALTSRELNLESPWKRFSYRPPAPPPAPVEAREPREIDAK